jgi:predicted nucleic acid-binding protein
VKVLAVWCGASAAPTGKPCSATGKVTDAYLTALASGNDALLATFDQGLARGDPQHFVLIP